MLDPADRVLTRRDAALPGLALLLDADAVADRLRATHLVDAVAARYVRYKPGENAVVAYDVTAGGHVHTVHAKAHRADAPVKLEKAEERPTAPSALGPGRVVWPDAAVVVSAFPNDAKLPGLARLADSGARRRLLARVLGAAPADADPVELRYKPERRWVGRVGDVVLKLHSASGYPAARAAHDAVVPGGVLRTVPLLGHSDRHRALATAWVHGRVLDDALRDPATDAGVVSAVGAALGALHRPPADGALPVRAAAPAMLAAAEAVAALSPALARRMRPLARRIAAALARHAARPVIVHGDFYAKQVLLSAGAPTVLDLDRLGVGEAAADLATFLAHLVRDRLRFGLDAGRADAVQAALLAGYAHEAAWPSEGALAAHTAAAIVGLAPHPFRFREPDWTERTMALLDAADASLGPPPAPRPPGDPAMPALEVALDPVRAAEGLSTALGHSVEVRRVTLRRHRPGRRAVVDYELADGTSLLAKVRAKGTDRATLRLMRALWEGGFDALRDVAVPEPLGAWPDAHAWLQRHVAGEDAWPALTGEAARADAARIARALVRLHDAGPPPHRRHTAADEVDALRTRVLPAAPPAHAARVARLVDECARLAGTLPAAEPRPVHRDFYPDNVLVTPAQIVLLDFDLYALGDPALDAGNFVAHLVEHGLRVHGDADALAAPARAFVHAFAGDDDARQYAVEVWTTLALVRQVAVYARLAGRQPATGALLDACDRRLATPSLIGT